MGVLCREGKIRMEVAVGLLLVIGMMLDGSEGLRCYAEVPPEIRRTVVTCKSGLNACLRGTKSGTTNWRSCNELRISPVQKQCWLKYIGTCVDASTPKEDTDKYAKCLNQIQNPTKTSRETTVESDGICLCFTDLCNDDRTPAGPNPDLPEPVRPNNAAPDPNALTILPILVAASIYAFNIAPGSF